MGKDVPFGQSLDAASDKPGTFGEQQKNLQDGAGSSEGLDGTLRAAASAASLEPAPPSAPPVSQPAPAPSEPPPSMPLDSQEATSKTAEEEATSKTAEEEEDEKKEKKEEDEKKEKKEEATKKGKEEKAASAEKRKKLELQLKHGKFSVGFGVQEYVVVPDGVNLIDDSAELVQTVLRHWKLTPPRMLLSFQSGFAHPEHLHSVADFELDCDANLKSIQHTSSGQMFEEIIAAQPFCKIRKLEFEEGEHKPKLKEVLAGMHKKDKTNVEKLLEDLEKKIDAEKTEKDKLDGKQKDEARWKRLLELVEEYEKRAAVEELNKVVYNELKAIMGIIVTTASKAGCWLLVQGGATGGHILLEEALAACKESKPVVLVVDSHLQNRYCPGEDENWKRARDKAKEDEKPKVQPFVEKALKESRKMFDELIDKDLPTLLEVPRATVQLDKLHKDFWGKNGKVESWQQASFSDEGAYKIMWNKWSFRSGTHYLFTESKQYWNLQLNELGTVGSIFIGGGQATAEECIRLLRQQQPIVLIDGTGRFAEEAAHYHFHNLWKQLPTKAKGSFADFRAKLQEGQAHLLQGNLPRIEKSEDKQESQDDNPPDSPDYKFLARTDIKALSLLYKRLKLKICRTIMVLDPFSEDEQRDFKIENELSLCLSNAALLCSSDVSKQADRTALETAWRIHDQLTATASVEKFRADIFAWALMTCSVLTVWLSIGHKKLQVAQDWSLVQEMLNANSSAAFFFDENINIKSSTDLYELLPKPTTEVIGVWLSFLPIWASFLLGISLRFRFAARWSKAKSALQTVEAEIFRFRTRARPYAVTGPSSSMDELEGSEQKLSSSRVSRELHVRQLFTHRIRECYSNCMSEMGISSLQSSRALELNALRPGTSKVHPESKEEASSSGRLRWSASAAELNSNSSPKNSKLPSKTALGCCSCRRKKDDISLEKEKIESHISIDEYCEERVKDTIKMFDEQATKLACWSRLTEIVIMLLSLVSAFFASTGQNEIVAVCIAAYTGVQSMEKYYSLQRRLDAANSGVCELNIAWNRWFCMEPLQRRFGSSMTALVNTVENVRLDLVNASTAGVKQLSEDDAKSGSPSQ